VSSNVLLFLTTFFASAVEAVEALTIVLAVGVVRGWRSTLIGVGVAGAVLAAVVAALGPALRHIPIDTLRFVVGALLLAFGMQWLRKAILRASGYKPLRDEGEAFSRERRAAAETTRESRGMDWYAFTVGFKGVLLEGLEVTFIVVTFGSTQGKLGLAAAAAAAASPSRLWVLPKLITMKATSSPSSRTPLKQTTKPGQSIPPEATAPAARRLAISSSRIASSSCWDLRPA